VNVTELINQTDGVGHRIGPWDELFADGAFAVEVAGIEPASFVHVTGLLRAQFTASLLGPTDLAN